MARQLPENSRHIRAINYRSAVLGRQLESLRLALIEIALRGDQADAVRGFAAVRDQIDLLEADMRELVRDQPPVT